MSFGPVPFTPNVAPDDFRADFPAFTDPTVYTDGAINFWIGIASLQLSQRWPTTPGAIAGPSGKLRSIQDLGVCLFVAHQLTVEAYSTEQAQSGVPPTGPAGVVQSKGLGPGSVGYDVGSTLNPNDTFWNLSIYGRRFALIARHVGAAPIQLGIGCGPPNTFGAWIGPWPFPGFFSS